MTLGHSSLAHALLESSGIIPSLRSEKFFYWLTALKHLSSVDQNPHSVSDGLNCGLSSLIALLPDSSVIKKGNAAAPRRLCCSSLFEFQVWYARLEVESRKHLDDLQEQLDPLLRYISSDNTTESGFDTTEISNIAKKLRHVSGDYAHLKT